MITTQENAKYKHCTVYMLHLVLPQLSFNITTHNLRTLHAVTLYGVLIASCQPNTANRWYTISYEDMLFGSKDPKMASTKTWTHFTEIQT